MTTRSRTGSAAILTLAMAGVLGLSACQGDTTVEGGAPTATSTSAPTTEAAPTTSEAAPSTTEEAPTSESPSSASSSASTSAAPANPADLKVTPKGTRLKYGQPGIINEGDERDPQILKVTVKKLEVAPDAAYGEISANKADGKLYFLTYDVTNVKADVDEGVNRRFLHPATGKGSLDAALDIKVSYGSTTGCKSDLGADLPVGQTVQECVIYQIPGDKILTESVYEASGQDITWTK